MPQQSFNHEDWAPAVAAAVRMIKAGGHVEVVGAPDRLVLELVATVIDLAREQTYVVEWGTDLREQVMNDLLDAVSYDLAGKSGIDLVDLAAILARKEMRLLVVRQGDEPIAPLLDLAEAGVSLLVVGGQQPLLGAYDVAALTLSWRHTTDLVQSSRGAPASKPAAG